jgi:hypothetical protein
MSVRPFSMSTVLRMTPNDLLAECFVKLGHDETKIPWNWLARQEIEPILAYLSELTPDKRNEIESVLHSVSDLAYDAGYMAILEAAPHCAVWDLPSLVPIDLCIWGRVMWVWLNQPRVFEKAQIIHQVDRLSWWRKRNDLPVMDPDTTDAAKTALAAEISKLFKDQGRGKDCTVEVMARDGVDLFFAYPDDFVQNVTVHDEHGKLAPAAIRQTLLVVFAYDRHLGTLETFAKLPKRHKERLEWIFASRILSWNLAPHEPDPAYELNHLKDSAFELAVDPADLIKVRIRRMRLEAPNGRRVTVEIDEHNYRDNIHSAIQDCLKQDEIPLERWGVAMVTFCFEFQFKDDRKPGQMSFDITYPRSAGFRTGRPERVELIQKYLRLWGIDCVEPAEEDSVAVGDESADPELA